MTLDEFFDALAQAGPRLIVTGPGEIRTAEVLENQTAEGLCPICVVARARGVPFQGADRTVPLNVNGIAAHLGAELDLSLVDAWDIIHAADWSLDEIDELQQEVAEGSRHPSADELDGRYAAVAAVRRRLEALVQAQAVAHG